MYAASSRHYMRDMQPFTFAWASILMSTRWIARQMDSQVRGELDITMQIACKVTGTADVQTCSRACRMLACLHGDGAVDVHYGMQNAGMVTARQTC